MAVDTRQGNLPHIKWIDLLGNGVLTECAVLKEDDLGNIYYIEVPSLDQIDKQRIARILTNRNAPNFELWDLMSQITLNNGVNALNYFHQLVKIITPDSVIMNPRMGVVGTGKVNASNGRVATDSTSSTPVTEALTPAEKGAATKAANAAAKAAAK